MSKKTPYQILEVQTNASQDEIKAAYRKMAMKHHPDRNANNHESTIKFKEIKDAYEILSDSERKSFYDTTGQTNPHQQHHNPFTNMEDILRQHMSGFGGGMGTSHFEEIFQNGMRGNHRSQRQSQFDNIRNPGDDVNLNINISLHKIINTDVININIPTKYACTVCNGTGCADKSKSSRQTCSLCKGSGQINSRHGMMIINQLCPQCQGEGQKILNPCNSCNGSGFVIKEEQYTVTIKATPVFKSNN